MSNSATWVRNRLSRRTNHVISPDTAAPFQCSVVYLCDEPEHHTHKHGRGERGYRCFSEDLVQILLTFQTARNLGLQAIAGKQRAAAGLDISAPPEQISSWTKLRL
jgi:hypothetical protein